MRTPRAERTGRLSARVNDRRCSISSDGAAIAEHAAPFA
jgi:hypothetical protein